jgi:hypothetical protein
MRILIIILSVLVGFISCRKNQDSHERGPDCSPAPTKYITPEISNFKFKAGTYWIFIDSISMQIDTMLVISASGSISPYEYCKNNYHEFYAFKMRPIGNNTIGDQYSLEGNRLMRNQRYEDGSGDEIYLGSSSKIDSTFIYDRYYKSVEIYLKNFDQSENGNKTTYFINTDYGFLKKEVYNSSNQLISKKLLKDKFIVR